MAEGLDLDDLWGPFQAKSFCDAEVVQAQKVSKNKKHLWLNYSFPWCPLALCSCSGQRESWAVYTALGREQQWWKKRPLICLHQVPWLQGWGMMGLLLHPHPGPRNLDCFVHAAAFSLFLWTSDNSLLCWPASLRHLFASRPWRNLNTTEHEAEGPVRASLLCAQLSHIKIPPCVLCPLKCYP